MKSQHKKVYRSLGGGISRRDFLGRISAGIGAGLLAARVPTIFAQSQSEAYADANIDWGQAAGSSLVLGGLQHPWMAAITPLLPIFTELTGIEVEAQTASEAEYIAEVPVTLGGGSDTPDVYMVWSMGQAVAAGWLEPLDGYFADGNLTDAAWYNADDIFTSARQFPVWPEDSVTYAMAITAEAQTLFMRGDLLEASGMSAPATFDDLYDLALALKTDDIAGIAMRAKPTAGSVPWSSGGYIFSYGGEIVDRDGRAAFDSSEAVAAIEMYAKTLRDGGPLGIGNYDWYESLEDYKQGFSAIACDSSNFATDIENPEASQIAGKTLYGAFPAAGDLPSKPNMWHWMIGMNAASMNKTGAWLFLKWATSAPTSAMLAASGAATTRTSAWNSEAFSQRFGAQAVEAALANLQSADGDVMTRAWFHPQSGEILTQLAIAVNEVIIGVSEAGPALQRAAANANEAIGM